MYYVYDNHNGILITQEEWEDVIRREEIDFSGDDFEEYLEESFNIKQLFQMTNAEKEVVKDDYVQDYIKRYNFNYSDRWTKVKDVSTDVEERISGQYIQHIKAQMKS